MANTANQKLRLLYVLEYIKNESDENHPVTTAEIIEFLEKQGIGAERRSIYDSIETLKDYGYDIISVGTPKKGYCLVSRDFEPAEIFLLTGAVQSAGFISRKKTEQLVSKLEKLLSREEAKEISRQVFIYDRNKASNEEIFYSIDKAARAIKQNKKISLKYLKRRFSGGKIGFEERELTVSPYAVLWANDHYYLVGNIAKYDNLIHLRIDRMKGVGILDENRRHFSEVSEYKNVFDIADYSKKSFNMFGGELCDVTLRCAPRLLDQVVDRFGENVFITGEDEDGFTFSTRVLVSEGLISWVLQYGDSVEVRSPLSLREMITERIEKLRKLYF